MVYRTISLDIKQRALYLLLEEGWEMDQITAALGVYSTSVGRWEHNYETHGCVNPPTPLRGRRRLLSSDIAEELHEMFIENPSLLLDEIGEWLAIYHDQPISTTALHDNLKDLGLTYKRLKRIAAERDNAFRADWLHNMTSNYTADQLVFLDESSKDNRAILRRYGRAIRGQPAVESVGLNRGVRYSILPALTIDGYMAVRAVEGSIDGAASGQNSLILFSMML
jgi:transposase